MKTSNETIEIVIIEDEEDIFELLEYHKDANRINFMLK